MLINKNKKFITIMVGLIIIVLLFSVVAIVALYTSPQPSFQIPVDSISTRTTTPNEDPVVQGNTFIVADENQGENEEVGVEENSEIVTPNEDDTASIAEDDTTTTDATLPQ